jgi:transcriptional regulator with XRE-family HTH domain
LTPARLRECLEILDWSQRSLALRLDVNERQVRRWASGSGRMPQPVADWLEFLARVHDRHPPPQRTKRTEAGRG